MPAGGEGCCAGLLTWFKTALNFTKLAGAVKRTIVIVNYYWVWIKWADAAVAQHSTAFRLQTAPSRTNTGRPHLTSLFYWNFILWLFAFTNFEWLLTDWWLSWGNQKLTETRLQSIQHYRLTFANHRWDWTHLHTNNYGLIWGDCLMIRINSQIPKQMIVANVIPCCNWMSYYWD